MLQAYRQHSAERAALGIPPLPLSAQQVDELIALIKNTTVVAVIGVADAANLMSVIIENETGRPWFNKQRAAEQEQLLERVGVKLRAMMPFLNPITVRPDMQS